MVICPASWSADGFQSFDRDKVRKKVEVPVV